MTTTMLPVGTYVKVTEHGTGRTYIAKVVGYDIGHTKYQLGARYGGWGEWLFLDGGSWAFPRDVAEISEAEALYMPDGETAR